MNKVAIADWDSLKDREPSYALVANVDLVVIRYDDEVSVLYGRCLHRGALLSDGAIEGGNLICGVHRWDFKYDTGVSEYDEDERLEKFGAWIENGKVLVDQDEIAEWEIDHP
jgi:nitrite reductase/ring-hydroxylating ferredoxin subunit